MASGDVYDRDDGYIAKPEMMVIRKNKSFDICDDDDSAILMQNPVDFTSKRVDTKSCSFDRCDLMQILLR